MFHMTLANMEGQAPFFTRALVAFIVLLNIRRKEAGAARISATFRLAGMNVCDTVAIVDG